MYAYSLEYITAVALVLPLRFLTLRHRPVQIPTFPETQIPVFKPVMSDELISVVFYAGVNCYLR